MEDGLSFVLFHDLAILSQKNVCDYISESNWNSRYIYMLKFNLLF